MGESSQRLSAVRLASTKHAETRAKETGADQLDGAETPLALPPPPATTIAGEGSEAPGRRSSSSRIWRWLMSCWTRPAAVAAGDVICAHARASVASSV